MRPAAPTAYRTSDLARATGVHVNTVRLYERIGLIAAAPRLANGYRAYSERHLVQLQACRLIYRHGWLGRELRRTSLEVLKALKAWKLPAALELARVYLEQLDAELAFALETAGVLQRWARRKPEPASAMALNRRKAAQLIGITMEALRNWERSGLLSVPRHGSNQARAYGVYELERLRIIKLLRQAGYSPAAIHASLRSYDSGRQAGVIAALSAPEPNEDAAWTVVGDRLLASLRAACGGARELLELIEGCLKRGL
jgi:DNA-binding transcriptional MerR regulator